MGESASLYKKPFQIRSRSLLLLSIIAMQQILSQSCLVANCLLCGASACMKCQDGFYTYAGQCLKCKESCRICTGPKTCSECKIGFFLDFLTDDCSTCPIACSECRRDERSFLQNVDCTKCIAGYIVKDGQCTLDKKNQTTIIAAVISGLVLSLVIALIIISCCKKPKPDIQRVGPHQPESDNTRLANGTGVHTRQLGNWYQENHGSTQSLKILPPPIFVIERQKSMSESPEEPEVPAPEPRQIHAKESKE